MYCIDVMREEHENILHFLNAVRSMCCRVTGGEEPDVADFRKVVLFARNYSDHQHHGKEEKFLFNEMTDRLGALGEKLVKNGMLVEHDLCRSHVLDLENALNRYERYGDTLSKLDIIEAAYGYATLLTRHIAKENAVVYPLAERRLPGEVIEEIDAKVRTFEAETSEEGVVERFLAISSELIARYGETADRHDEESDQAAPSLAAAFSLKKN